MDERRYHEIISRLYTREEVYRPPQERNSLLLEVGFGCSYAKCSFCDFVKDDFFVFSDDNIFEKISLLAEIAGSNDRVFLQGCNVLCLPTERLIHFAREIHARMPQVTQISMYSRADDILRKGPAELTKLRAEGITDLHIGVETGSDRLLKLHSKGVSVDDCLNAFRMLDRTGIFYHISLIPGLGGKLYSEEHSRLTAALLNQIQPISIWNMGLKIWEGTRLYDMVGEGSFEPLSYPEMLREERLMISLLDFSEPCAYVDSTALGKYTIAGELSGGKDKLLEIIDRILEQEGN